MKISNKLSRLTGIIYYAICQHSPWESARVVPDIYTELLEYYMDNHMDRIERAWFHIQSFDNSQIAFIILDTNDGVLHPVKYYDYSWMLDDGSKLHVFIFSKEYLKYDIPHARIIADKVFADFIYSQLGYNEPILRRVALFCMVVINRYIREDYRHIVDEEDYVEYTVAANSKLMRDYFQYYHDYELREDGTHGDRDEYYERGRLPEMMIADFADALMNRRIPFSVIDDFEKMYIEDQKDDIERLKQLKKKECGCNCAT